MKAIIFDVGGVLLRTEDWSIRRGWEDRLGLERGQSDELVFESAMGIKAQLGIILYDELWRWIGRSLDLDDNLLQAFHTGFWAGDVLDTSLVKLIRVLKSRYLTGIISNYHNRLRYLLTDEFAIADAFDVIVCSAEEHIMKPSPEIYKRTLRRLQVTPESAMFIDDSRQNTEAAIELGMKAIHYQPPIDLKSRLHLAGFTIEPKR